MATQPLLDLSTLLEQARPTIRIDGRAYQLKAADELSLIETHRFATWATRLEEIGASAEPAELEELVETIARACVVDVPVDVFSRLSPTQHMSIVEVFTGLLLGRRLRLVGAIVAQAGANRPTGENSFPGSSRFSAASPKAGSAASRPVS